MLIWSSSIRISIRCVSIYQHSKEMWHTQIINENGNDKVITTVCSTNKVEFIIATSVVGAESFLSWIQWTQLKCHRCSLSELMSYLHKFRFWMYALRWRDQTLIFQHFSASIKQRVKNNKITYAYIPFYTSFNSQISVKFWGTLLLKLIF